MGAPSAVMTWGFPSDKAAPSVLFFIVPSLFYHQNPNDPVGLLPTSAGLVGCECSFSTFSKSDHRGRVWIIRQQSPNAWAGVEKRHCLGAGAWSVFCNIFLNICLRGVEFLGLCFRVENAKIRRGVWSASRNPLPPMAFAAGSQSIRQSSNHFCPMRQCLSMCLVRKDPTIMRPRLCMRPVTYISRMAASTKGSPVRPCFHLKTVSSSCPDQGKLSHSDRQFLCVFSGV